MKLQITHILLKLTVRFIIIPQLNAEGNVADQPNDGLHVHRYIRFKISIIVGLLESVAITKIHH